MSWTVFGGITALILAAWAFHASLAARETANRFAIDTCRRAEVQLLDGTVSLLRMGLARAADGGWTLRRTYVFDYSEDGCSRQRGFVVLSGLQLESVGLALRART